MCLIYVSLVDDVHVICASEDLLIGFYNLK